MAKIVKTQVEIEGEWHERESLEESDDLERWDEKFVTEKVGKPIPRLDGFERVAGIAEYTYDVQLPGMLYGAMLRSPYPHARVKHIGAAERLPGVRFVLTNDTLGNLPYKGPAPLFNAFAKFEGEPIAAVCADDCETAHKAVNHIKVTWETLPFVTDPSEALQSDAPPIGPGKYSICAALLSKATGRPVQLMLTRQEENLAAGNRPAAVINVRLGAKRDGTLTAIEVRSRSGVGAYGGGSPPVTGPAKELYKCGNVYAEEQGVLTNTGTASAFRAPGYVEGTFALESSMDILAEELGLDPVAFRLKNYAERQQVRDLPYSKKNLADSYENGMKAIDWAHKRSGHLESSLAGPKRRGVGMASQIWGGGGTDPSYAITRMNSDGTFDVLTGSQDIGTGTKTVMAQITAEEIGVSVESVRVAVGDTLVGPFGILSAGSLTVPSVGPAVRMAAKDVKDQILDIAATLLDAELESLTLCDGVVKATNGKEITIKEVAERVGNFMIIGKGARGANSKKHNVNTFGAHFAEVEVDIETGEIGVISLVTAHEFGRILNPLTLTSQIEGGAIQGFGFGLFEGRIIDRNTGKSVNPNLEDYKIPTALDIPDIVHEIEEHADPIATSIGSKGAGEPPIIPPAAAIANAVYDAIGVRIYDLPITPAKILNALRMQENR